MSTPLAPLPIRLFCDQASVNDLQDINRGGAPAFYRGDDIEIDIGIGVDGVILSPLSNVASVTAQVFASESDTAAAMMTCTVLAGAMNLALTNDQWNNWLPNQAAQCHAAFIFPAGQTAISLGGQASRNYWLRITAQTSDATPKTITLLDGNITVKDGPAAPTVASITGSAFGGMAVGQQTALVLLDPADGLYHVVSILNTGGVRALQISDIGYAGPVQAAIFPTGALFRSWPVNGQIVLQLFDPADGLYHTMSILNTGGVRALQLSDQGY